MAAGGHPPYKRQDRWGQGRPWKSDGRAAGIGLIGAGAVSNARRDMLLKREQDAELKERIQILSKSLQK